MAKVAMPSCRASEAATSSWVDRGFDAQATTVAPPSRRVRSRLAVSVVMCRQAPMVTPSSGRSLAKRSRMLVSTGMWLSAQAMRWRPSSASSGSAMSCWSVWSLIGSSLIFARGGRQGALHLFLGREGARVPAFLEGHVQRREVADEDEVEELGQLALPFGLDLLHR